MKRNRALGLGLAVLLVFLVAGATRWKALTTLNIDFDEDDYMRASQEYTAIIRSGDLSGILETNYRPEHPPLTKIVVGLAFLTDPEKPIVPDRPTSAEPNRYLPRDLLRTGREMNAIFGVLTAGLLAIVNPLAGLLLGIHTWSIKYVSQIMLESIPAFTSLVSVICFELWKKRKKQNRFNRWLVVSAIFLGITAASKYLFAVIGIAILVDWLIEAREEGAWKTPLRNMVLWGLIAVAIFFVFDPYLWPDPLGRLKESILYHTVYSQGAQEVERANYPVWQQLSWLFSSPRMWQTEAFYFSIDPLITVFAFIGLGKTWSEKRLFALWLMIGMFFLLIWPTKWPQYLVTISVPLCFSAVKGMDIIIFTPMKNWVAEKRSARAVKVAKQKSQLKKAIFWLIPGAIAFIIFTLFPLLYQAGVSLTDFNSVSLRDGLNGGIWREVSGGLTGKIPVEDQEFPFRSKEVHYLGISSFQPVFSYISANQILFTNILWTVVSVGLQALLGMIIALILWQRGIKFKRGWQALFILPWAIPELIGALMWVNVFAPSTGWLALAAQKYGPDMPFHWLIGWETSSSLWFLVLLISGVWYGFPFLMLATYASLKMMPSESLDAAQIDGANNWQTFRFIIWPLILPLLLPAIIIRSIFAFNQFYLFKAFGFFGGTLATLSFNFFNPSGFYVNGQFAISAVINLITIAILIGFVLLFNRWSKAGEGVTYA